MQEFFRPSTAQVDLAAVEHNYRQMRAFLGRQTRLMAVVKADAYGHGAVPVSKRLLAAGAEWLGVAQVQEAVELRLAEIRAPILLLQGIRPEQAPHVVEFDLTPLVFQADVLQALSALGAKLGKTIPVHIKVDTGMSRLGVLMQDLAGFFELALRLPGIRVQGLCSHFASSEQPDSALTRLQKERFAEALALAAGKQLPIEIRHLGNSAAAILDSSTHYDMVRLGIALYGAHPAPQTQGKVELRPALSWRTSLHQVKELPPDTPVSYGATFRTDRRSRIGILPVGYEDGLSRSFSNNCEVLVKGQRCPVVGTVCMDLAMVDVTDVPDARAGDDVVLIGEQLGEKITAEEMGARIGTIPYEILCGLGRRVARVYQ